MYHIILCNTVTAIYPDVYLFANDNYLSRKPSKKNLVDRFMVDENNHSCFKRSSTVKYLRACSAVRLLVLDYSPVLLGDTEKNLEKPLPPTPSDIASFCTPPPLWISVAFRGGGGGYGYMDIFWNYTVQPALYGHPINKDTFHGPLSIHLNAVWLHSSQLVSLKNKSITIPLKHHCWNPRQVEYRHLQRKHLHPLLVIHQYIEPENMQFKLHASV